MTGGGPEYQEMMRSLHEAYREELPKKGRDLEEVAESLLAGWNAEREEALYCLAHRLAGSSAVYGFEAVRAAAEALEAFLVSTREGAQTPPEARDAQLRALVQGVADASGRR